MKFKLISVIDDRAQIDVCRRVNGIMNYCYVVLEPNTVYDTEGDELLERSLREAKFKKNYDSHMEQILKDNNIPYTVEACKVCGGRVKKLIYNPIEEVA